MTIQTRVSNRRAGEDSPLLLNRLEAFVNLADDFEAFDAFFREYPGFLPVNFYSQGPAHNKQPNPVGWEPALFELFRVFRNLLRRVWKNGDKSELAILLGIDEGTIEIMNRQKKPPTLDRVLLGPKSAIEKAMEIIPRNYLAAPNKVVPDWSTGAFCYEANTDFLGAIYELFRQSWRAAICPQCRKYFIADKPPQRYCSSKCYGAAKRTRDLQFWRNVGSNRRKKRIARERRP